MKQFDVLKSPEGEYQAVKQGYCWPAFFFTWIWALLSKLWDKAATLFILAWAANIAQRFGENLQDQTMKVVLILGSLVIGLCIMYYTGKHGNRWRREMLVKKGYEPVGETDAESKKDAIAKLGV